MIRGGDELEPPLIKQDQADDSAGLCVRGDELDGDQYVETAPPLGLGEALEGIERLNMLDNAQAATDEPEQTLDEETWSEWLHEVQS